MEGGRLIGVRLIEVPTVIVLIMCANGCKCYGMCRSLSTFADVYRWS